MDIFSDLIMGFSVAISPINMLYLLIGAMVGMVVGRPGDPLEAGEGLDRPHAVVGGHLRQQ